jgi:hypothetical protein
MRGNAAALALEYLSCLMFLSGFDPSGAIAGTLVFVIF